MYIPFGRYIGICYITGSQQTPDLTGTVKFYQADGGVLVVADVFGLPETESGIFGFHIHEGISCQGQDFPQAKGHFNLENLPHPLHAGDLPPLFCVHGRAFLAVLTDRFRFSQVVGRTLIIHDRPDDFATQPAGNSGSKIGCGVIRVV